ncbi:MAG: hypothetical protein ACO1N0_11075 [Fluviicola sp.]
MIEQISYLALGIVVVAVVSILTLILSNKLNVNYAIFIVPVLALLGYAFLSFISIKIASIGSAINGIIAGCIIGLFGSTVWILIARKFVKSTDESIVIKQKITLKGVFLGVLFSGGISIVSIYIYREIYPA